MFYTFLAVTVHQLYAIMCLTNSMFHFLISACLLFKQWPDFQTVRQNFNYNPWYYVQNDAV